MLLISVWNTDTRINIRKIIHLTAQEDAAKNVYGYDADMMNEQLDFVNIHTIYHDNFHQTSDY